MRTTYLVRKGTSWTFQIRLPRSLAKDSTLAAIRVPIGSMPAQRARAIALQMAAAAQTVFGKVRAMADESPMSQAEIAEASKARLRVLAPYLIGLDLIGSHSVLNREETQNIFDTLLLIGASQEAGDGALGRRDLHHEAPYFALLQNPAIARAFKGIGNLDDLTNGLDSQLQLEQLHAKIDALNTPKDAGPLFSAMAKEKAKAILGAKRTGKNRAAEYMTYATEFIALQGDKPVGDYTVNDLENYVNEMSWRGQYASKEDGYKPSDVRKWIEKNKKEKKQGLSYKSLKDKRLSAIKAIIRRGCDNAKIDNRVDGRRITIPDRAARPVKPIPPDNKMFERVWRGGIDSGILADALLPALALISGRRVGLIATLLREDLYEAFGVHFFVVRSHAMVNGEWQALPIKTDSSTEIVILPNIPAMKDFIEWVRQARGPLFPALMACKDPADTAQKRMGRLIHDFKEDGDLDWVFRALRDGKINSDRDNRIDGRLIRKTVGHESLDVHENYGTLTPKQMIQISETPVPEGIDWDLLRAIDFETFAKAKPRRTRPKKKQRPAVL